MNVKEAAERLNDNQYREEGSSELFEEMRAAGLVAVFGASDDLVEFRGAIYDEAGAYDGTTVYVDQKGLLPERDQIDDDVVLQDFFQRKPRAAPIEAKWDSGGFSWQYETTIPHETFIINEDDEPYCEGIVFALDDVPA